MQIGCLHAQTAALWRRNALCDKIAVLVADNVEKGIGKEKILGKLQKYFGVSEQDAGKYYEKYALWRRVGSGRISHVLRNGVDEIYVMGYEAYRMRKDYLINLLKSEREKKP